MREINGQFFPACPPTPQISLTICDTIENLSVADKVSLISHTKINAMDRRLKKFASRWLTEQSIKLVKVQFIGCKMYICIYIRQDVLKCTPSRLEILCSISSSKA